MARPGRTTCDARPTDRAHLLVSPGTTTRRTSRIPSTPIDNGADIGPAAWPAIIDGDDHERVVTLLTDPDRHQRSMDAYFVQHGSNTRRYLLTYGIGSCGVCGGVLRGITKRITRHVARERSPANPEGVVVAAHPMYACDAKACVGRNRERVDDFVGAVVVERLSRPDAADVPRLETVGADDVAAVDARELRRRLDDAAEDCAAGLIDRGTAPTDHGAAAAAPGQRRGLAPPDLEGLLRSGDIAGRWRALSLLGKRAVLDELCTVVLLPTREGAACDPHSVRIVWSTA